MASLRQSFVLIAYVAISSGCNSAGSESSPGSPTQLSSVPNDNSPSTTASELATTTTAAQPVCPRAEVVDVGGCIEVDTNGAIYLGDDVYIATRPIVAYPGRLWERTDFPAKWDVEILNQAPDDGHDWIIRNVHATRIDERTLEVVEPTTGDLIGTYLRDERPPEERPQAG
jgi:hypothetical protein